MGGVAGAVAGSEDGWVALGYLSILAVGSTVLASIVFFRLVQRTGAVFASNVSYLIPVVALAWGLWDGEGVNGWQLPGAGLILAGIWVSRG